MRSIDWNLAIAVKKFWMGKEVAGVELCPLLANRENLVKFLDEAGIRPGLAVAKCPACGDEHRWVLIKLLMEQALEMQPVGGSALLAAVNKKLEEEQAFYGGKEKYQEMRKGAEEFFAKIDAKDVYSP